MLPFSLGHDRGFDYRQKNEYMNQIQYSKLIYPYVKPMQKMKIGILKEAVSLCSEEVKNVFQNALNSLNEHELLEIMEVSYQKHAIAEKVYFPVCIVGAYGCMMKGDGFGTGISGNNLIKQIKYSLHMPFSNIYLRRLYILFISLTYLVYLKLF